MLFEREPQIQLCIQYYYHNNPDSIHNIVSDLQKKVDERIRRVEKELDMNGQYWCKVLYSDKKLVFEFRITDSWSSKVLPHPFEIVTYNAEVCGDKVLFILSDEDKDKLESEHMDTMARAFLDETF